MQMLDPGFQYVQVKWFGHKRTWPDWIANSLMPEDAENDITGICYFFTGPATYHGMPCCKAR